MLERKREKMNFARNSAEKRPIKKGLCSHMSSGYETGSKKICSSGVGCFENSLSHV